MAALAVCTIWKYNSDQSLFAIVLIKNNSGQNIIQKSIKKSCPRGNSFYNFIYLSFNFWRKKFFP
jgi:hypothetical protein